MGRTFNKISIGILANLIVGSMAYAASVDGDMAAKIAAKYPKLPPIALKKALQYLAAHEDVFKNQEYMAIANFDQPSTEKRLYLINLRTGDTETHLVSHGKNSADPDDRKMAKFFSNTHNSKKSSLGFYRTLDKNEEVWITNSSGKKYKSTGIYAGKHGRSLRLKGVQSTNSNALNREIVMHGATYVSQSYIKEMGRLGLSWGCPAVDFDVRDKIMDRIEGRGLFYIYRSPEAASESKDSEPKTVKKTETKSEPKKSSSNSSSKKTSALSKSNSTKSQAKASTPKSSPTKSESAKSSSARSTVGSKTSAKSTAQGNRGIDVKSTRSRRS